MKVPNSVRTLYESLLPSYKQLKAEVDRLFIVRKQHRWHFESRIKTIESFALKLETGRELNLEQPEDLFACTLVVENHSRVADAESLVSELFDLSLRRPRDPGRTNLKPADFSFDDLRLYVKWQDEPSQKPSGLAGIPFEVQIKTFLQHAWGIATHDVIYKSDDVDWSASRIAFQAKAMLEHAEVSIAEAHKLTDSATLSRTDNDSISLKETIVEIKSRWSEAQLPKDVRRLAENIRLLAKRLRVEAAELWEIVDEATEGGRGVQTLNLSPYGSVIDALLRKKGPSLFDPLLNSRWPKHPMFVPGEIDLSSLGERFEAKVVQPPNRIS